jgi:Cu+-exporting ATPase
MTARIDLTIGGMTCTSCAHRVERTLNRLDGVVATVNHATDKASVSYPDRLDPAALVAEVEAAGHTAAVPGSTRRTPASRSSRASRCRSWRCRWSRGCNSPDGRGSRSP